MKVIGKIILDGDGYVCISWENEVGKLVTEKNLQEKASEICDIICEDILNEIYD